MPIQLLPTAINFLRKQAIKQGIKKAYSAATDEDTGIKRLNKGEKIDWENTSQEKYFIYLDNEYNKLGYADNICGKWCQYQGTVYCLDQNFLDVAIQEIGEGRLIKYLRGE